MLHLKRFKYIESVVRKHFYQWMDVLMCSRSECRTEKIFGDLVARWW